MGKNMYGKGGKPKPQKSRAKKPPKAQQPKSSQPSAIAVLSEEQMFDRLSECLPKVNSLIEAVKVATAAKKKYLETLEKNGLPQKRVMLAVKMQTAEGEQKVKDDIVEVLWVSRAVGSKVPQQLKLIAMPTPSDDAFAWGRRTAAAGQPARLPPDLSNAMQQHWLKGHAAGREAKNMELAEGFKPLGVVAGTIVPGSGADAVDSLSDGDRKAA